MKPKLLALLLLAGGSLFARSHFFAGVGFGGYYAPAYYPPAPVYAYAAPPAPLVEYRTACPGPAYSWVSGYYYPSGPRYSWRAGYWARRPFVGARWAAPRYYGHRYYGGYWRR